MENINSPLKEEETNSKSYKREMKINLAMDGITILAVPSARSDLMANQVELPWIISLSTT